ncbi:MAG: PaaI family thioesterase [bacterium]
MTNSWIDYIRDKFTHTPFFNFFGVQIASLAQGKATLVLPVTQNLLNTYGTCHGGALSALADMVMGIALRTLKIRVVTVELALNYLQPVPAGKTLIATAHAVHRGRRMIVAETEIYCQDTLVAKGKGTFFVTGPDNYEN